MTAGRLLNLPFDQYQRYRLLADIVETLGFEGTSGILEVGGSPVKLPEFLPGMDVTVCDVLEDRHPGYLRSDATSLPFPDQAFGMVTSLDTLEHIEPEKREIFLKELARTASEILVIGAPFKNEASTRAEKMIFDFIKSRMGYEHQYFKDHLSMEKPDMVDTESFLVSRGFHTIILPNGRLDRWILMMFVYYFLDADTTLADLNREVSAFYNRHYYDTDNAEPAYRHFIVASREEFGEAAARLAALSGAPCGDSPDFEAVRTLIELAGLEKQKGLQSRIRELENTLAAKDTEIKALKDHEKELENFVTRAQATPIYRLYSRFFKKGGA